MPIASRPTRQGTCLYLASILVGLVACSHPKDPGPPAAAAAAAPTPAPTATPTLYAWATPLIKGTVRFADHTWVTSYDMPWTCPPPSAYWYSWGSCHPAKSEPAPRALDHRPASLKVAICICQPDVESYQFVPSSPAHGGIDFYGIDGVCHQLSNRILFATAIDGAAPATVSGAHAYAVTRFVYGTYGSDAAEWAKRKSNCMPSADAHGAPVAMDPDADFAAMLREKLSPEILRTKGKMLQELHASLRTRKSELDQQLVRGSIPPRTFAEEVNKLINENLKRASESLGAEAYERLFGIPAGETIGIVDPDIAELSNYKGRR